ncbi:MAG: hypothetical protein WC641_05020 [Patescibacteria group bacterium]
MKQRNARIALFSLFVALIATLVSAPVLAQQPTDKPRKACCSNFKVYTESLLAKLLERCGDRPDKAYGIVEAFITEVSSKPGAGLAQECPNINPNIKVGTQPHELHGCYEPGGLLEKYMAAYKKGLEQCLPAPPILPVVQLPNPCEPALPDNGCGNTTIIVMPLAFPVAPPVTNYNTFNYNISYTLGENNRSEKPTDPKAPEPLQPQMPTENVFGTAQSGLLRPSETRLTAVQLPVVITDNGTYGTAGVSFSPYRIYQLESDTGAKLGLLEKTPLLGRFLKRINVSLGATKSPGMMEHAASANGAVAISLQHWNDHDPEFNRAFGEKCLKPAAEKILKARDEACQDQKDEAGRKTCLDRLVRTEETEARRTFRECLRKFARSAASTVFGASADVVKAWYTYEGSLDWYLSWLAYGGMQYNRRQDVYVPAETGGQMNLTTASFSAQVDMSLMAGVTDNTVKLRPTGGLGIAMPTFNGMTVNFGVRVMPLAWNDAWSDHPLERMEKRYVVGIGWAGDDAAIKYFRNLLKDKSP